MENSISKIMLSDNVPAETDQQASLPAEKAAQANLPAKTRSGGSLPAKTRSEGNLPAKTRSKRIPRCASVADMACKPLPEMEADVTLELDRLQELSDRDPLLGLDAIIGVIQGIDIELAKINAPLLIENAQLSAAHFAQTGKVKDAGRAESRALESFHRTNAEIAKLGAARVKVRDELNRRQGIPGYS